MNAIVILVSALIVVAGIYFNQRNQTSDNEQSTTEQKVLSEETEIKEEVKEELLEVKSDSVEKEIKVQIVPTEPSKQNIFYYKYPNSTITSSSANYLLLKSSEDSELITNWYRELIKSGGMNAKSFVSTKTNGNVLNKLVGADGTRQVRVEVSKPADQSTTTIEVNIN